MTPESAARGPGGEGFRAGGALTDRVVDGVVSRLEGDDDRTLVRRMRAGEEQAFDQFFELYFQPVYRFALSRLDRQPDLAKEIAQAAICRAIEKLHLFRGEARLLTWICAICRFEISAYRRRQRRDVAEPLTEEVQPSGDAAETVLDHADPERRLLRGEVARQVHQTVDLLPVRYAQALTWKYSDELPVTEIARRLGLSAKAAESLLTRARAAFRAHFPMQRGGQPSSGERNGARS
jgi:RNA polymerase sigma-70 factor, ECF subfamily